MKNIQHQLMVLLFTAFPFLVVSQENFTSSLNYEVNKIYPPVSITKEKLNEVQTLLDLSKYYKPSWIKEYIAVEIWAKHNGKIKKATSKNDTLNQAQKNIINMADVGSDISVEVLYMPENNLSYNEPKVFDFTFILEPESEATYYGGEEQLMHYLKEKAIDKIPDGTFINWDLAAVKFTVDEDGTIMNVQVFESSKDEKVDQLLLQTIQNMPCWKPAEYANETKVKQECVLTVGNMENCVVNLLNIYRDWPPEE